MHCGVATPTDPGVPPRVASTGAFEVKKVTEALAGRYKVEKIIGEGGMATVYLAMDQKHKRRVAVKVMRPELAATLGADRFLREVEIAGQLSHPHILPMHDSGESDGLLYYVMPYVPGETLRERLLKGALAGGRCAATRARDRGSAGVRAPAGHRASRHQAGQHPAERRSCARGRLRHCARGG